MCMFLPATNVHATRLKRWLRTAQRNPTEGYVAHFWESHHRLFGNCSVLTLTGKVLELVEEVNKYLDIVGVFSTKRRGSRIVNLNDGWKSFYSDADPSMSAQAGEGILSSP